MDSYRPAMNDPKNLTGQSPSLGLGRVHTTTSGINKHTPISAQDVSKVSRFLNIESEAESSHFRRLNPFGDETYPASAKSSVHSKVLKDSHSFASQSEDIGSSGSGQVFHMPQARTSNENFQTVPELFSSCHSNDGLSDGQLKTGGYLNKPSSSPGFEAFGNEACASSNLRQPYPGSWKRIRNYVVQSTQPDGSTIDNILRQYNGSEVESMTSDIQPAPSFHRNLSYITDESSFLSGQNEHPGQNQALHRSTVPPTRKIGLPRSTAETDIASIATAPSVRVPLEQAVMMLRSNSDDSLSSHATSTFQGGRPQQPSPKPRQQQLNREVSEPVSIDEETRCLARTALCYNKASMDPTWNVDENIRPPPKVLTRQPTSEIYKTSANMIADHGDRDDDWATIDSNNPDSSNRISSSIGTVSTLDGINYLDVAERVVQHPGGTHYEGNYRSLNLKNNNVPVMAPSKGPFRINGFAADSLRTRPPHDNYMVPAPLATHKNPFTGQPPKIPAKSRDRMRDPRSQRGQGTHATSSSSFSTNRNARADFGGNNFQKSKRWDDNDPILSMMNPIPTIHPDQLVHSRQNRSIRPVTVGRVNTYQGYNSSSTTIASYSALSGAQVDESHARAYSGAGRSRRDRLRYSPSKRVHEQFASSNPYPYAWSNEVNDSESNLLDSHRTRPDIADLPRADPFPRRPHLTFQIQEPRFQNRARDARQERITLVFLILCNLFPPLLVFFWFGKLDNLMGWWTCWEYHQFTMRGKRVAWILSLVWAIAALIALTVVLFVHLGLYLKGQHH